jgi:hypothetical protein
MVDAAATAVNPCARYLAGRRRQCVRRPLRKLNVRELSRAFTTPTVTMTQIRATAPAKAGFLLRLAAALPFLFGAAPAVAQMSVGAPSRWDVHNEDGPMDLHIEVTLVYVDPSTFTFYYTSVCKSSRTFMPLSSGYIVQSEEGCYAYSDDSGLWSEWVWRTDHYDKQGGSPAIRSYYPG